MGEEDECTSTLWMGDLAYWMDENYLYSLFAHTGEVVTTKIIRNKVTGYSEGYGFVQYMTRAAAEKVLRAFNGMQIPNTEMTFRLNWATYGIGERKPDEVGPEYSIFVGDLAADVTDYMLQEFFRAHFPSTRSAKVVTDPATGRVRGYGFVRFSDEKERDRAMSEMNGQYLSNRPMRISLATPKKNSGMGAVVGGAGGGGAVAVPSGAPVPMPVAITAVGGAYMPAAMGDSDPNNTTIFVGGLDQGISEEDLRKAFSQYGDLVYVKIPAGKGCGFVQFVHRSCAEDALVRANGLRLGAGQGVRLSWGRSPTARTAPPPAPAAVAYAAAPAGYAGYPAAAAFDPSMAYATGMAAAYGGYPAAAYGFMDPYTMQHQQAAYQQAAAAAAAGRQQGGGGGDPRGPADIESMNARFIQMHEGGMLGRHAFFTQKT